MVNGVKFVVVLQHQLQQCRGVQTVGAAGLAGVAVDALFHLVHFGVPLVAHVLLVRRPAQQGAHAGGLRDIDPGGAGQAIAAAAAEVPRQLLAVMVDDSLELRRHAGRLFRQCQPLVQLPLMLVFYPLIPLCATLFPFQSFQFMV